MKKLLALLLALAMLLSFAACSQQQETPGPNISDEPKPFVDGDDGKPYEVNIIYRISPQDAKQTKAVVDHINNNILPDLLPNTTISITFIPQSEYMQTMKLKFASEEKMDLVLTMVSLGYADFASQEAYEAWDYYLPLLEGTISNFPETWLDATRVAGQIYGIPNYQITARANTVSLHTSMIQKYNIDVSKIKTYEDLAEYYYKPLLAGGEFSNGSLVYPQVGHIWTNNQGEIYDTWGLEQITDLLVVDKDDPTKVLNLFETDAAKSSYEMLLDWANKGYMNADVYSAGTSSTAMYKQGLIGSRQDGWQVDHEKNIKNSYGQDVTVVQLSEPLVTTSSVRSTMTSLAWCSKNPYRAAKVYELINTNEELFNAICYGVEGVHYTKNSDGTVTPITDSGYNISGYAYQIGNTKNQWPVAGRAEDYVEQWDTLNKNAKSGLLLGFGFDTTNVQTEMASVQAIYGAYREGFIYGKYSDVEATLKEMNDKMYAAGLQRIIDVCQKQLDEWYASK